MVQLATLQNIAKRRKIKNQICYLFSKISYRYFREKNIPNDNRPRKAIEAAELYLEGKVTKEQIGDAANAANAANAAAYTAANANAAANADNAVAMLLLMLLMLFMLLMLIEKNV